MFMSAICKRTRTGSESDFASLLRTTYFPPTRAASRLRRLLLFSCTFLPNVPECTPLLPTMEPAAEPLIPSALPPHTISAHPADRDLNSSPSPSPSPPPTARVPPSTSTPKPTTKLPWIPLAALSGGCAAINGVFAKLTTTALTTSWATAVSHGFGLKEESKFIEFVIRAVSSLTFLSIPSA